jgi:hypothetical protein
MVYFLSNGGSAIKIGFTDRTVQERISELQTGCPDPIECFATIPSGSEATEAAIHRNWHSDRIRGEWFNDSPAMRDRIRDLCDHWNF